MAVLARCAFQKLFEILRQSVLEIVERYVTAENCNDHVLAHIGASLIRQIFRNDSINGAEHRVFLCRLICYVRIELRERNYLRWCWPTGLIPFRCSPGRARE